jgi:methylmalonyl-CoA mutase
MREDGNEVKLNEFPAATYEDWLKLVERDLAGAAFEKRLVKRVAGLDVRPLYVRADETSAGPGLPGFAPFTRGATALGASEAGWDVRQEISHADPAAAGRAVLDELNGGATSIAITFDGNLRRGVVASVESGPRHADRKLANDLGVAARGLADLELVLQHVPLDATPVRLSAGASALPAAAGLIALAARRRVKTAALAGSLGADPLGTLAAEGELPTSVDVALEEAAELALWSAAHAPQLRAIAVDTSAYHDAGADAATEVAVALATGAAYLRALTGAGLAIDAAARQIAFTFSVGRDFFIEIAKLRAARCTWSKVVAASGGDAGSQAMNLHARTSRRTKSRRDPWVNLLRGTAETFAAVVGGADAVTTASFDAPLGESDDLGRRMARNTQHILRHESNVHRVVDPAGGSWYVEAITDGLARRAWEKFQGIERSGGLAAALSAGALQADLKGVLDAERTAVETRKTAITGVNEFPNVREPSLERPLAAPPAAVSAASPPAASLRFVRGSLVEETTRAIADGAAFLQVRAALDRGAPARVTPLAQERLAQPFEALRDRADRLLAATGRRPAVFLANLGPIAEHKARAGFAQNAFEAGGFLVAGNDGFDSVDKAAAAFAESGAEIAALCSSDAVYAELAEPAARALRDRGAKAIVLAGAPGVAEAAYRAAGVTDFVFVGVNVAACLGSLLERAGAV